MKPEGIASAFGRSLAVVVGIDEYRHGIPRLTSARRDAIRLAEVLEELHGFEYLLLTEDVTLDRLIHLLDRELPEEQGPEDRLLFYFAGHGIARDSDQGLAGFLLPQDAHPGPDHRHTLLAMDRLKSSLEALPCRHLLVVLDCCFAGAFRWSMTREVEMVPEVVHRELYERFVGQPAWQVLTSAAHDQRANDVLWGLGHRDEAAGHSPFARALFEGLAGAADLVPPEGDGLITATELFLYLRDRVETLTEAEGRPQTPGLWSLLEYDRGEYVFEVPDRRPDLPPAPDLDEAANPYRGLETYEAQHEALFFGRERLLEQLAAAVPTQPLTVILGASGTGKSSLVRAGLLPLFERRGSTPWLLLGPLRPGRHPMAAFSEALGPSGVGPPTGSGHGAVEAFVERLLKQAATERLLIFVDQYEELQTQCRSQGEARQFEELLAGILGAEPERVRVVLTVRSDFEASLAEGALEELWDDARVVVPPMTHDELRRVILGPASRRVLFFESDALVEELVEEVLRMPGALPLLSFTLQQLYWRYLESGRTDRTLNRADYEGLGKLAGAVSHRAEEEYRNLVEKQGAVVRATLRRVMLRMVDLRGVEPTRRRVPLAELDYASGEENLRVEKVLDRFLLARLIVRGRDSEGRAYVEPAHEKLIVAWQRLRRWIVEEDENLTLLRRLTQASEEWSGGEENPKLLWDREPRVGQLRELRESPSGALNALESRFARAAIGRHRTIQRRTRLGLTFSGLFLVAVAAFFFFQRNQARSQRDLSRAQSLAARAVAIQSESRQDEVAALVALRAYRLNLQSGREIMSEVDDALRTVLREPYFSYVFEDRANAIQALEFSPDGHYVATAGRESRIRLWPVADPRGSRIDLEGPEFLMGLTLAQGGRTLVGIGTELVLWDLGQPTPQEGVRIPGFPQGPFFDVKASTDGERIAVIGWKGVLHIADLAEHDAPIRTLDGGFRGQDNTRDFISPFILHVRWHPREDRVLSTDYDGRVFAWDLREEHPEPEMLTQLEGTFVHDLAISPEGRSLALAGHLDVLQLYELETKASLDIQATGENEGWRAVSFSPDGQWIVASGGDDRIYLWQLQSLRQGELAPEAILEGHTRGIYDLAVRPDGKMLASGGAGGMMRLWDLERTDPSFVELAHTDEQATQLSLCDKGRWATSARSDGTIQLWDLDSLSLADEVEAHGAPNREPQWEEIRALDFDPTCRFLASGGEDRWLKLWGLDGDRLSLLGAVWDPTCKAFKRLAVAPDGRSLAVGCEVGTVRLWNVEDPTSPVLHFEGVADTSRRFELIRGIAFHPQGNKLVSGSGDGIIKQWDLRQSPVRVTEVWRPSAPEGWERIYSLAYSPDGEVVASGHFDGAINLWREGESVPRRINGHEALVWSLAFTPDGKQLVSAGRDGDISVWDLEDSTKPPLLLRHHGNNDVRAVAVEPDGRHILSAGEDGRIVRSLLATEELAAIVCDKVRHDISPTEWSFFVGEWAVPFYEPVCPGLPLWEGR